MSNKGPDGNAKCAPRVAEGATESTLQQSATDLREMLLGELGDLIAEKIASKVVARLKCTQEEVFVDQASSPLGPRRHIDAIRSGKLAGKRVGRKYVALARDVENFLSEHSPRANNSHSADLDSLANELGVSDLL